MTVVMDMNAFNTSELLNIVKMINFMLSIFYHKTSEENKNLGSLT